MVTITRAWRFAGLATALTACGGEPFVFTGGDASADGVADDATAGNPDAPPVTDIILCPNQACHGGLCCIPAQNPNNASNCTGGACGCDTQLACSSDENCGGLAQICCIGARTDSSCNASHFVAQCRVACLNGDSQLCNPSNAHCPALKPQCSTDSGDLQGVGLPSDSGYGVCTH